MLQHCFIKAATATIDQLANDAGGMFSLAQAETSWRRSSESAEHGGKVALGRKAESVGNFSYAYFLVV